MKYPVIAQRLKEAMADKEMKAVELSARSGILKSSISQYMNGTHSMPNAKAGAIAEVLGVNPVWLMGFDVPKYKADGKSQQQKYYLNDEDAEIFDAMATNPKLRALYYLQRKMSKDEIEASTAFYNAMASMKHKEERLDEDDPC